MNDFGYKVKNRRESLGLSQEDLARILGYSDKSSISKIENNQRDITRGKVAEFAKALKTTPAYLMGWTDIVDNFNDYGIQSVDKRKIQVIGNVHCGTPEYAEEEYIDITDSEFEADFALRVIGDSMIDIGIEENDLVFIRKQSTVENGQLAVVLIGDEAAVKRIYKYDTYISLNAENPAFAPLIFKEEDNKEIRVLGKVVAHTHYYKERKNK